MIPELLFYKIVQLFAIMLLGFLIVKLKVVKSDDAKALSKISLYLLLPAAIISAYDTDATDDISSGLILAFVAATVMHFLLLLIDILYKRIARPGSVERASVMYSNAGNLIIPIVTFVLGAEWVIYSTAFLSVQLIFIWTHGISLFTNDKKMNIKKILLNPSIIAIAIGIIILLTPIQLPSIVADVSDSLASMVGSIGMLIAGMTMAEVDFKKVLSNKRLYISSLLRLIVCPIIILGLVILLRVISPLSKEMSHNVLLISYLAAITPSAASVLQFAKLYENESDLAVSINAVTTILSILTMPLFVMLYQL